jgi:hypothetical protein
MKKMCRSDRNDAGSGKSRGRPDGAASPGLYIGLAFAWCVMLAAGAAALCNLIRPRLGAWHPSLARVAFLMLVVPVASCALFFVLETLSLVINRDLLTFVPFAPRRALIMAMFPLCRMLGGILGRSRESVSASCIALNNRIAQRSKERPEGGKLLVLLPRCLQNSECRQMLIESIGNCRRCGRCAVARLLVLKEKHAFDMAMVTGGELAKKIVGEVSPSRIIAVACENELVKGLQEISHIPIMAIRNRRPAGPCKDTVIDIEEFEQALHFMAAPRTRKHPVISQA